MLGREITGVQEYTSPLSHADVLHLLKRSTFAFNWTESLQLVGKTAKEAVDLLFANANQKPLPKKPTWADTTEINPWKQAPADQQKIADAMYKRLYDQNYELKVWWTKEMENDTLSIREKMTLFLHGHFTTKYDIDGVQLAQNMLRQNQLFRQFHQGNFKELTKRITLDNAMLVYLNGGDNTKVKPNENYSRELLELYTVGLGHYTEKDIQEGARILTGWISYQFTDTIPNIPIYSVWFDPNKHDIGTKVYLGKTITSPSSNTQEEVRTKEVNAMIDTIFERKSKEVANHISKKLFDYFLGDHAKTKNQDILDAMSKSFISSNFELSAPIKLLLTSSYFFDKNQRASHIKSPAETITFLTKHFAVKEDWKSWVMDTMGQALLNPPTVAGWSGNRKWIDTRSFPFGVQHMGWFMWNQTNDYMVTWTKQYTSPDDAKSLVTQILTHFFAKTPTTSTIDRFTKILLGNAPDYEWPAMLKNTEQAGNRLKTLFVEIIKNPNFHLS
ncbi:MAG: DUF1800 domain-containing protein [Leadbetterella sp.]